MLNSQNGNLKFYDCLEERAQKRSIFKCEDYTYQ